jgi:lysophospholipase L1-like esterase
MKQLALPFKRALSLVPTKLPIGMTEFVAWADSIIELAGPIADKDSMQWVIASTLINLGPQCSCVAKNHFVRTLRKAAASQVAGQVFQDIKNKQKEAAQAAVTAQSTPAEDTATTLEKATEKNVTAEQQKT